MKKKLDNGASKDHFEDKLGFFPYGVQYHRAPTPLPEEWDGDLQEIARAGYTHVQFRPQWRWHERVRGKATWGDLDRLFELAAKHKLRVVLKPMLETAPDWVFDELEGTRIGFRGVPISPTSHGAYYVGGWWPCFDNPAVVKAAARFIREMTKRYHRHPALWFYDAWNEPVSRPLGACHCCHSQESYRKWLGNRFGTIETLNNTLGKAWTSLDSVRAPEGAGDHVEMFLWRQWAGFAVAEQVRFVSEAIRAEDKKAFVMVHTGGSLVAQDVAWAASDDFQNAAHTDRYGTSLWIPLHPKTPTDHAAAEYQSSWLRRVDPLYWCHEFYPNNAGWCQPPEPRTLNRLVWSAIAGGLAGFTFWQWKSERFGNETNGYGLRNIDGTPTPRSEVADGIAAVLKKHGSRLVGTRRVPSRVAMLYSHESDMICRIQVIPNNFKNLNSEPERKDYPYKRAIRAAHALYQHAGEAPDWVISGDDLAGISVLHVTGMEIVDAKTADWLRAFVRGGGTLVVEFPFACRDERTWVTPARPAHGLEDLLGCREADRVVASSADIATFTGVGSIAARDWRIALKTTKGKVIANWQDGSVAAVEHSYGKGRVFAFGTNLSLAYGDTWREPVTQQVGRLLLAAGVQPASWHKERVNVFRRRGPQGEIWFVMNYGDMAATVPLPLKPLAVWETSAVTLDGQNLRLEPGATWVGEMPVLADD